MSKVDLYTVSMRRDIPVKTPTGNRIEEVVETFKNMTWEESLGLRKTFSHVADVTLYKSVSGTKSAPKGKSSYSVRVGAQETQPRTAETAPARRAGKSKPAGLEIPSADLTSLVNEMAKERV